MTEFEKELREKRSRRIRRVKRWLRPLPRRTNIHRYPILNRFAKFARKRSYLWSFRVEYAVPAIYAGCILVLLPLFGIQFILALVLALVLRANLPILAGLQFITNPLTVLPIWFALYQIGRHFLLVFGLETLPLERGEVGVILKNFIDGAWGSNFDIIAPVFGITSLGALIVGSFAGLAGSMAYRLIARRTAGSYALLRSKIHGQKKNLPAPASSAETTPGTKAPPEAKGGSST
jgi:uncharacterized protein